MGQKVNPIGMRLGITNDWFSRWYANKKLYRVNLLNDINIRRYINENLSHAMVARVIIKRKQDLTEVIMYSSKPGIIIGKKGVDIENIKRDLSQLISSEVKVDVVEIKIAESNAMLIANNIVYQLKKRLSYRKAMKKAIQSALSYGIKGVRISCSGRLNGAEIARTEWHKEGRIPLHTLRADIDYGFAQVKTVYGMIGVKAWVYKGDSKY